MDWGKGLSVNAGGGPMTSSTMTTTHLFTERADLILEIPSHTQTYAFRQVVVFIDNPKDFRTILAE